MPLPTQYLNFDLLIIRYVLVFDAPYSDDGVAPEHPGHPPLQSECHFF